MKTIGLIGGMSWESSLEYYRLINQMVKERLGGLHSAKVVMVSFDFGDIEPLMRSGRWETVGERVADAARRLEVAGADVILICTNTVHKVVGQVEEAISVPLLHIVDATAAEIKHLGIDTVGLLGTRFTMEEEFYRGRLRVRHGIHVIIPEPDRIELVDRVIFEELCKGVIKDASKQRYREIMNELVARGTRGIVLGCTEIPLLVTPEDCEVPLFDTTTIHARAAVDAALA